MPKPFTFCLCADDYAMTPGVSRGILEALAAGRLSATSAMTTSPWWPEHASALAPFWQQASIGLHLNLTLGAPLGHMPHLAPSDVLPDIASWIRRSRGAALPLDEVAAEIDRQFDRFADCAGRPPAHIDGHQHVHILPPIRRLIVSTLARRGWHPWLRDSADRPWRILQRGAPLKKAFGVAVLARGFKHESEAAGFAVNDGFSGFSSFDKTAAYSTSFERYLKAPGRRHLVMCHPGYADDALRSLDPVVETREQELAFLLSPAFEAALVAQHATLSATPLNAPAVPPPDRRKGVID